ncbi:MAG: DegT/DnrJ/EryC1/StrS family aminotransferase [Clostridiaceae bacterium]|jgi:dTDP-4-amino-4,6-dideoxygalactose transaminase|nr:DegT/DnrJ/EryC1/StrS family aminotransferase [Clostridiaceae bacterium]
MLKAGGPGAYCLGEEERKELMDVIESGYLFRYGSMTDPRFCHKVYTLEQEFASANGVKHCLATTSGTASLLCCLAALGIGEGDEVIVPGYTFIASISSIMLMGATPVLCEINNSLTLDPECLEEQITDRTKAIMAVHMLGNPCDMDAIMAIAKKHNLYVIEDCCQAAGARYKGKPIGTIGHIGAFSLNIYKTITSGDGGLVITNDSRLYERAFGFHDQGHLPNRSGVEMGNRSIVGMNFRMNELTGAVALAQSRKLNDIIKQLRAQKSALKSQIKPLPGFTFRTINDPEECATLLTLIFDEKKKADLFCEKIGSQTISHSGWHVYNNMEQILEKKMATRYHNDREYRPHMLPKTDDILERAVNISIGVVDKGLGAGFGINIHSDPDEISAVANNINKLLEYITSV